MNTRTRTHPRLWCANLSTAVSQTNSERSCLILQERLCPVGEIQWKSWWSRSLPEHDFPSPACYCITQEISNLASNPGKHFLAHVAVLSCWPSLEGEKEEAEDEPAGFKPFSAFWVPYTGNKDKLWASCLPSGEWLGHVGEQSSRSLALVSCEWCVPKDQEG